MKPLWPCKSLMSPYVLESWLASTLLCVKRKATTNEKITKTGRRHNHKWKKIESESPKGTFYEDYLLTVFWLLIVSSLMHAIQSLQPTNHSISRDCRSRPPLKHLQFDWRPQKFLQITKLHEKNSFLAFAKMLFLRNDSTFRFSTAKR